MEYLKRRKQIIGQLIFSGLIFVIPSNLFKILDTNAGYVSGLRVDYLIPKLYLSDIFLLLLAAYLFFTYKNVISRAIRKHKQSVFKIGLLSTLLYSTQLLNSEPLVSILFLSKVILLLGISILILTTQSKKLLYSQLTKVSIFLTILFQAALGILQFIKQSSVGSYLPLGETNLQAFAGIAKGTWNHVEYILPYGTTAHPNILAGTLVIFFVLSLLISRKQKGRFTFLPTVFSFILATTLVLLTQSYSAGLMLLFSVILLSKEKKWLKPNPIQIFTITLLFGLLISLTPSEILSIERRSYLNRAAVSAFIDNPLWGVGAHKFTAFVEQYSTVSEVVRFTQPAHNFSLLLTSEFGVIGQILIGGIIATLKKAKLRLSYNAVLFLNLVPILALDHYLYTIQTGILLIWLVSLYSFSKKSI